MKGKNLFCYLMVAPALIVSLLLGIYPVLDTFRISLIIVPFQPHVADLETVVGWYLSLRPELQERVAFVPNRLENTLEQREGIAQLEAIIVEEGRGKLLSGLRNRPAVYPPLLNGSTTNFFDQDLGDKVKEETNDLLSALTEGIAVAGRV